MEINKLQSLVTDASESLTSEIREHYHHLHMYPELSLQEEKTAQYIESYCKNMGLESRRAGGTGVIVEVTGKTDGPLIALRADTDALAVQEETGLDYSSRHEGVMHACGHDAHTAMLLGALKVLHEQRQHLKGTVRCIFQPGEEGQGGAKILVDEGVLKNVEAIFGMHVWSEAPSGTVLLRKGALLASSDRFDVMITGKGGHAAIPHLAVDPVSVLVDIYNAFQKIVTREIDPLANAIITVPMLEGSQAYNIISSTASFQGSLRTISQKERDFILSRMKEIVEGYSAAWRCRGELNIDRISYPPLINNGTLIDEIAPLLENVEHIDRPASMGSEDFAFYCEKVPGAFLLLGTFNEKKGTVYAHHHPKFHVDEDILSKGAALYALCGFLRSL